jgi:hypothetical protein
MDEKNVDRSISKDEPTYPMGGQVWKHKMYGHEVWILSTGVSGVRYKALDAEKDEQSSECSESEFKSAFRFERWRV